MSLWRILRCHSVEKLLLLSTPTCGGCGENDDLHRTCGKLRSYFQTFPGGILSDYPVSPWRFGCFDKLFHDSLCKTSLFPHGFPQVVENGAEKRELGWISCGSGGGEAGAFPHRQRGDTDQFPLISLTISSISARNTGFCAILFSTASREEITVEWSRSIILPMLGRDISVTWRMT